MFKHTLFSSPTVSDDLVNSVRDVVQEGSGFEFIAIHPKTGEQNSFTAKTDDHAKKIGKARYPNHKIYRASPEGSRTSDALNESDDAMSRQRARAERAKANKQGGGVDARQQARIARAYRNTADSKGINHPFFPKTPLVRHYERVKKKDAEISESAGRDVPADVYTPGLGNRYVFHNGKLHDNVFKGKPWKPPTDSKGNPYPLHQHEMDDIQAAMHHHTRETGVRFTPKQAAVLCLKAAGAKPEHMLHHLYGGVDEPDHKVIDIFHRRAIQQLEKHETIKKLHMKESTDLDEMRDSQKQIARKILSNPLAVARIRKDLESSKDYYENPKHYENEMRFHNRVTQQRGKIFTGGADARKERTLRKKQGYNPSALSEGRNKV